MMLHNGRTVKPLLFICGGGVLRPPNCTIDCLLGGCYLEPHIPEAVGPHKIVGLPTKTLY